MSTLSFPYSPCELRKVKKVQFGIFSPEEIKQMSVVEITTPEAYENGKAKAGGLADPALGAQNRQTRCQTCASNMTDCPGHFGHLVLEKPVFNIGFLTTILKILRCVCYHCSKLLLHPTDPKYDQIAKMRNRSHRMKALVNLCKGKTVCEPQTEKEGEPPLTEEEKKRSGCGNSQPKITKEGMKLMAEFKGIVDETMEKKSVLSAEKVLKIFQNISEETCFMLGLDPKYARPDWMIITVLPIPPPPVRPSISMGTMQRGEDDLTHKLSDIVKANNNLKNR